MSLALPVCTFVGDANFSGNTADTGGALYLGSAGDVLSIYCRPRVYSNFSLLAPSARRFFNVSSAFLSISAPNTLDYHGAHIMRSSFDSNNARKDGGGLFAHDFIGIGIAVDSNVFMSNTAGFLGGAIAIQPRDDDYDMKSTVANCTISNNVAGSSGGGIAYGLAFTHQALQVVATSLDNNTARGGGAVFVGVDASIWLLDNSTLTDNRATNSSGGGGLLCEGCSFAGVRKVAIQRNTSPLGGGGGVSCQGCGQLFVQDSLIDSNAALRGGGVDAEAGSGAVTQLLFDNVQFVGNNASGSLTTQAAYDAFNGTGGGLRVVGGLLLAVDSTFEDNHGDTLGGGMFAAAMCSEALPVSTAERSRFEVESAFQSLCIHNATGQDLFYTVPDICKNDPERRLKVTEFPATAVIMDEAAVGCSQYVLFDSSFNGNDAGGDGDDLFLTEFESYATECRSAQSADDRVSSLLAALERDGHNITDGPCLAGNYSQGGTNILTSPVALHIKYLPSSRNTSVPVGGIGARSNAKLALYGAPLELMLMDARNNSVSGPFPGLELTVQANIVGNKSAATNAPAQPIATTAVAFNGTAQFDDLALQAPAGQFTLQFSVPQMSSIAPVSVVVNILPCTAGEIIRTDPPDCEVCQAPQYSINATGGTQCNACPEHAICLGGATLAPMEGYWHAAPNATQFFQCPNPRACRPRLPNATYLAEEQRSWYEASKEQQVMFAFDPAFVQLQLQNRSMTCMLDGVAASDSRNYMRQICSPSHYGRLCGKCLHPDPDTGVYYGLQSSLQCRKCLSKGVVAFLVALAAVMALAVMLYSVGSTLSDSIAADWSKPRTSDYFWIVLRYVQYAAVLSAVNPSWPDLLSSSGNAMAWITLVGSRWITWDCLMSSRRSVPLSVQRSVAMFFFPICLAMMVVVWFVFRWRRRLQREAEAQPRLSPMVTGNGSQAAEISRLRSADSNAATAAAITNAKNSALLGVKGRLFIALYTIANYLYPSMLTTVLSVFSCYKLGGNGQAAEGYWLNDTDLPCYKGKHLVLVLLLGVPGLLICGSLPVSIVVILYRHRASLMDDPDTKVRLGFLYHLYKPQYFYWTAVAYAEMFLVVALSVFLRTQEVFVQTLVVCLALLLSDHLLLVLKPMKYSQLQRWAVLSLCVLSLTMLLSLLFTEDAYMDRDGQNVLAGVLMALNAIVLIVLGYQVATQAIHSREMNAVMRQLGFTSWKRFPASFRDSGPEMAMHERHRVHSMGKDPGEVLKQ